MTVLSRPLTDLEDRYDAVVIGSGYGGGVAASRLSRMGLRVALLERGIERLPGDFPDTTMEATRDFQCHAGTRHIGKRTALFDLHVGADISALVGCGLGGTSLINANVSLEPEDRVFEDTAWPDDLREEVDNDGALRMGFERARTMLQPEPYPEDWPRLAKFEALGRSAGAMGAQASRVPINVRFASGPNAAGVNQPACNLCGDCCSGCNTGAKNTTAMNYLADAVAHGCHIYCGLRVRHVTKAGTGGWRVAFLQDETGREKFDHGPLHIHADTVVLGAGTLGSTEILLRSREEGLNLSPLLGQRFSGNGDVLGFGYNNDQPVNGIGMGRHAIAYDPAKDNRPPVGPTIVGGIDLRGAADISDAMIIEEGAIPGGLSALLPSVMAATAAALGEDTDEGDWAEEKLRELSSLVRGPYRGAVAHTQTYLVMAHDGSDGEMRLEKDCLKIHWPDVGERPQFEKIAGRLRQAVAANGGKYVPNPIWTDLLGHSLITVHPLGGCTMGSNAETGVVDADCRVFDPQGGVYDGLLVCDGSVLPRSVGVNPLLTITAVAERAMMRLAERRGLTLNTETSTPPLPKPIAPLVGLRFTEKMAGQLRHAADGSAMDCSFVATVTARNAQAFFEDRDLAVEMIATVQAPDLSPDPMSAVDARFKLFSAHPEIQGARAMEYRMPLVAADGTRYLLLGRKTIRDDAGFDIWADTTTLATKIIEGDSPDGPVLADGVLSIAVRDFIRQLSTIEVLNSPNARVRLSYLAKFGKLFGGSLVDAYL